MLLRRRQLFGLLAGAPAAATLLAAKAPPPLGSIAGARPLKAVIGETVTWRSPFSVRLYDRVSWIAARGAEALAKAAAPTLDRIPRNIAADLFYAGDTMRIIPKCRGGGKA